MVILELKNMKLHQHQRPILIKKIDINEIVACKKVYFGRKDFTYFLVIRMVKKLDLYVYCFQKRLHIDENLTKLNICLFL